MKKLTLLAVISVICTLTACKDNPTVESSVSDISVAESTSILQETSQSTAIIPAETTSFASAYATSLPNNTTQTEIPSTEFPYDTTETTTAPQDFEQIDGGIVFNESISRQDDDTLISAAIMLYKSACETEWAYTVGSPYELDTSQVVENMYGWESYLVVEEGIYSLDDVRAGYHKVFSEDYPDKLDEVFTEANGGVYCLNGARGADIFYTGSSVVSVNSRSDSRISFTAESYYSGDDFGNDAYTVEDEFVISIDSDGAWRVAKFRMPY